MDITITPSRLDGLCCAPPSKSHTIRAVLIASLAHGDSMIRRPLLSDDARSCITMCRMFGARIDRGEHMEGSPNLRVIGVGGKPHAPDDVVNVGNSGTTMRFGAAMAGLVDGCSVFTGDEQLRARPIRALLDALAELGASAETTRSIDAAPCVVRGPLRGGSVVIDCPTSQYLSALLFIAPLTARGADIFVTRLHERPYVEMTLAWLRDQRIAVTREGWRRFSVRGGQSYRGFDAVIPGDFSSAAFLFCAAAITGSAIEIEGLPDDETQGDRAIVSILRKMGSRIARVGVVGYRSERAARPLGGGCFDLNDTPDLLPALAATACYANERVELCNVPQARIKESDRISVMAAELGKMGANIEELPDGMIIHPTEKLRAATVDSHGDHRVAMALAIAALGADGPVVIENSECVSVTFPDFFDQINTMRVKQ